MNSSPLYALALSLTPNLGGQSIKKLLQKWQNPETIFNLSTEELEQSPLYISPKSIAFIQSKKGIQLAFNQLKILDKQNIKLLIHNTTNYPLSLKKCPDAPFILYLKGPEEILHQRSLSIIGTRKPSLYGTHYCKKIIQELKVLEPTIISGMAHGIDATAHKEALALNLPTIAVLAHGLDHSYPIEHKKLKHEILSKGGAIVSEYPLGTFPRKANFPMRNRITAGLADGVLLIESNKKGGSMITANIAVRYQKPLFTIPGSLDMSKSSGCNRLIKERKALLVESANDISQTLRWGKTQESKQLNLFSDLSDEEKSLLQLLNKNEAIHLEQLLANSSFSLSEINTLLFQLELKEAITALPGKYYSLL